MAKGKRRTKKAARRDSSNHRLPTFNPLTSYIDQMVGNPTIYPFVDVDAQFLRHPSFTPAPVRPEPVPQATPIAQLAGYVGIPKQDAPQSQAPRTPKDECVRRSERTEIMHASGKAGKRGQKSPLWTEKSKIKC